MSGAKGESDKFNYGLDDGTMIS